MKRFIMISHFQNVFPSQTGSNSRQTDQRRDPSKWDVLKLAVMVLICLLFCPLPGIVASELTTIDSGICVNITDHRAVGIGDVFSKDVEKLFCFTRVLGPYLEEKGQHVVHVWYYKETEKARITLPVESSNWGTYSSKMIRPFEIGDWHVDVLDPDGEVISVFQFFIKE